jgi:signal-transduction protein with cAMP-binding, CBS, and nucleotidyltransferase domain
MEPSTTVERFLVVEKAWGAGGGFEKRDVSIVSSATLRRNRLYSLLSIWTLLGDIMSSPVMCVRPHQTWRQAMALMTRNRVLFRWI